MKCSAIIPDACQSEFSGKPHPVETCIGFLKGIQVLESVIPFIVLSLQLLGCDNMIGF